MQHASHGIAKNALRQHQAKQAAQNSLRAAMALLGGWHERQGHGQAEAQRAFFARYGTTAIEAAALGRADAELLDGHIRADLERHGIIDATVNRSNE